jgi:hypothetical protein
MPQNICVRRCCVPDEEPIRSLAARAAAELALVRVVHHYGGRPEFVLLGGLVPPLLCANSGIRHAGTTDVDVQVDLEISSGAVHAARLENALRAAGFQPDDQHVWRWRSVIGSEAAVVKFELLADLATKPAEAIIRFSGCQNLGAVNLRGTGNAARDSEVRILTVVDNGVPRQAEVNVAGIGGFLLAKAAAAHSRRKPKDWYDIAFVLLHNDQGDARYAAERIRIVFGPAVTSLNSALADLKANFGDSAAQGTTAYVNQITLDHPDTDPAIAAADSQLAVQAFCDPLIDTGTLRSIHN